MAKPSTHGHNAMPVREALRVLIALRRDDQIVVTNQGSSRIWPRISSHPLDFHYLPSTMGGAVPFGLGLALAQPTREVLVCSGDGALLMNLGSLISVVDAGVTNLTVVVLENGVYEVTGGQRTAAANGRVDFAALARSCGFGTVARFSELTDWRQSGPFCVSGKGPRFISVCVEPTAPDDLEPMGLSIAEQIERLRVRFAQ